MNSGLTSSIDSKYRVSFAADVLDSLSWKADLLGGDSESVHFMGPGTEGFLIVVSGKIYAEWSRQLKLAEEYLGTLSGGNMATLARGHAGLIPFNASIEVKRFRFTLPRDLRVLGFEVEPGDELAAIVRGDLFEIYPKRDLANSMGAYWKLVGQALSKLRTLRTDDDWIKLRKGGSL